MYLFSKPELNRFVENSYTDIDRMDKVPAAKLYIPGTGITCLVTELCPARPTKGYALMDDGDGSVTFGEIDIDHIVSLAIDQANHVRRDPYFVGKYPIRTYLYAAKTYGFITDQDILLAKWDKNRPPGLSLD